MNKVTIINLNGRAYQIEEAGYEKLHDYLSKAAIGLEKNPDKEEITADLEQAIADKCNNFLSSHKNIILTTEIELIIQEMGPVDSSSSEETKDKKSEKTSEPNAPKKLYQIRDGAVFSGVCMGLAAYLNIDVTIVRVIFLVLAILTHGIWVLVYFLMAIFIPYANTSEQQAEAHGQIFNANELIQRAREKYAHYDKKYWHAHKHSWQNRAQENKIRANEFRNKWESEWKKNRSHSMKTGSGVGAVMLGIVMALISFIWVIAIISLVTTGMIFGFSFTGVPLWLAIVLVTCAYNIILLPLRTIKFSAFDSDYSYGNGWFGLLDAVLWCTILGTMGWLLWTNVPQTHLMWEKVSSVWQENQETQQIQITQEVQQTQQTKQTQITQETQELLPPQ